MGLFAPEEWPARRCSGDSCKQGRAPCQTPEACEVPERADELQRRYWREAWTAAVVIGIVALLAVFA